MLRQTAERACSILGEEGDEDAIYAAVLLVLLCLSTWFGLYGRFLCLCRDRHRFSGACFILCFDSASVICASTEQGHFLIVTQITAVAKVLTLMRERMETKWRVVHFDCIPLPALLKNVFLVVNVSW